MNNFHNSRKLFFFSPSKFRSSGWVRNVGIFYSIFVLYIKKEESDHYILNLVMRESVVKKTCAFTKLHPGMFSL